PKDLAPAHPHARLPRERIGERLERPDLLEGSLIRDLAIVVALLGALAGQLDQLQVDLDGDARRSTGALEVKQRVERRKQGDAVAPELRGLHATADASRNFSVADPLLGKHARCAPAGHPAAGSCRSAPAGGALRAPRGEAGQRSPTG